MELTVSSTKPGTLSEHGMLAVGREANDRSWRVAAIKSGPWNAGNLRACQLLLGHRKLESTVGYLGIEVDDALEMSEQIDL